MADNNEDGSDKSGSITDNDEDSASIDKSNSNEFEVKDLIPRPIELSQILILLLMSCLGTLKIHMLNLIL